MERFDFRLFSQTRERPAPGTYAMWWMTPQDSDLRRSPTIACIDRVYRAVDGYMSYLLALMLQAMGTARPGETRVLPIPRAPVSVVWRGPEGRLYPLSVSEEKGIRFYLPVDGTTVPFREEFWRLFAEYAEERRRAFVGAGLPRDPPSTEFPGGPPAWWQNAKSLFERLGGGPKACLAAWVVEK